MKRRVLSSYRWPRRRLRAKKVSQVSSSPLWQKAQLPQGMMNGEITLVPAGSGCGVPARAPAVSAASGPYLTTSPQIS